LAKGGISCFGWLLFEHCLVGHTATAGGQRANARYIERRGFSKSSFIGEMAVFWRYAGMRNRERHHFRHVNCITRVVSSLNLGVVMRKNKQSPYETWQAAARKSLPKKVSG
jgi:hypothetical protein